MKTVFFKRTFAHIAATAKLVPNFISSRGLFRKGWLQSKSQQQECSVKFEDMRTLRFRPSFPTCINRKVSDGGAAKKTLELEMGDFPLHILETRRNERLAELKAECLELKHQLSEHSLQAALLKEAKLDENSDGSNNKGARILSGRHSKSMHELRRGPQVSTQTVVFSEESMRRRREERLQKIRRELEEFAIKYSIGEYAEKIDGIEKSPLKKSKSDILETLMVSPSVNDIGGQIILAGSLQGVDTVNAAILLRIQRQREQELQRARMELKHLAFRLKHKLDEENSASAPNEVAT